MKKYLKAFTILLCVFLSISVLLSAVYLIHNSMHDCAGENCHICHVLSAHKDTLNVICLCFGAVIITLKLSQLAFYVNSAVGTTRKGSVLVADKVKITC